MIASVSFRNFKALRSTQLKLLPFNLVIGPNGSGKTSLIQAVMRLRTLSRLPLTDAAAQTTKPHGPEPKPEPKPRVDPFQEQLKREAETLTQRKQAESAAQELSQLKSAQASAARNKAVADYLGRIRGKIRGNIVLPPDIKGNPEAVFEVTQLPGGEVISVKIKKSSGNPALDAAVERAILKSSPLPKPEQSDLFDRLLNIPYRPIGD